MPRYVAVSLFFDPEMKFRTELFHINIPNSDVSDLLFDEQKGVWCVTETGARSVDFCMVGEVREPKGKHFIISVIERGNNAHIDTVMAFVARKLEEKLEEFRSELRFFEPLIFPFSDERANMLQSPETGSVALLKSGETKPST